MELLIKAERFCAYQERSESEVKRKLFELGADSDLTLKIIASLKENGFLDDERFSRLYASGKFRIKQWGKNKIRAELRMRKIHERFIKQALEEINEEDYMNTIRRLVNKKEKSVKGKNPKEKTQKIFHFLLSRGFESDLIWKCIKTN